MIIGLPFSRNTVTTVIWRYSGVTGPLYHGMTIVSSVRRFRVDHCTSSAAAPVASMSPNPAPFTRTFAGRSGACGRAVIVP